MRTPFLASLYSLYWALSDILLYQAYFSFHIVTVIPCFDSYMTKNCHILLSIHTTIRISTNNHYIP